ncbi:hypothetical protein BCY91_12675 [Pelobium manganitolerans]|uniref:Uncharacterized protein n=2 Tax=Pelobium manganitolerans TaxID=1842495 RepID=A0A419S1Y0_9SPHI|nr:hypothetical protein BCY91_12675 [Pelobium manganitolerans]
MGVQTFVNALYALDEDELLAELEGLADLVNWMKEHFLLSGTQEAYLDNMSTGICQYIAEMLHSSLAGRIPVNFNQVNSAVARPTAVNDDGKLLDLSKKSEAVIINNQLSKRDSLNISISYLH